MVTARAFDKLPTAIFGKLGEVAAMAAMKADGASTISLCRIDDGGAPLLERGPVRGKLVLPDVQAFNWRVHPGACFVEIKTYAESREFQKYGAWIHGIPARLHSHYLKIQADTNLPVYLGINELDTGTLRISDQSIDRITKYPCACRGRCRSVDAAKHIPSGNGIQEMQWYLDRNDFTIIYKHDTRTIERLRDAHAKAFPAAAHAYRKQVLREPAPTPILIPASARRDVCSQCGDRRNDNRSGWVTLTICDAVGERVVCAPCWRKLAQDGQVVA